MNFDGKVILVTGASAGIGADAARHLAKLGAKVSIVGRNENRLNAVADEIKKSGSISPLSIVADVTKDAERIVNETIKHFGQLDVLLNNAGICKGGRAIDANLSEFDRIFNTNVRAVINLTKLCVPHLEKTKGNVVNVSSGAGTIAVEYLMNYGMSKAALNQFTKCAALDLAPKGIRVNSINLGVIRTGIHETSGLTPKMVEELFTKFEKICPLGRVGEVSDTSAVISFLADNKVASFLTGVLLPVDGAFMIGSKLP